MTPREAINKEFNNRFIINTYYDERTFAPIYYITDTINNKQYKTLSKLQNFSSSFISFYKFNLLTLSC